MWIMPTIMINIPTTMPHVPKPNDSKPNLWAKNMRLESAYYEISSHHVSLSFHSALLPSKIALELVVTHLEKFSLPCHGLYG